MNKAAAIALGIALLVSGPAQAARVGALPVTSQGQDSARAAEGRSQHAFLTKPYIPPNGYSLNVGTNFSLKRLRDAFEAIMVPRMPLKTVSGGRQIR